MCQYKSSGIFNQMINPVPKPQLRFEFLDNIFTVYYRQFLTILYYYDSYCVSRAL